MKGTVRMCLIYLLTEKALRKTRHWIIPSMVSPVRQKVPVRCLPFLSPIAGAAARLACTRAPRGLASLVAPSTPGSGAPSISLASGSIPAPLTIAHDTLTTQLFPN
ncbi:unnamed protein product [Arctia plantaginis]|uniref:Uncharacterized protein n=1 Tax=Arctia plantaginis TaxID=874455 RepID=A0A8S1A9T3_ARCPL|nr:unnamed protein product [Arctia plantaginis]